MKNTPSVSFPVAIAMCAYVGLAAIELARTRLYEPQASFETGTYAIERIGRRLNPPPGRERFRWTAAEARFVATVRAPILVIPFYSARPDLSTGHVTVAIYIDDRLVDERTLTSNGWSQAAYFLPPLIGRMAAAAGTLRPGKSWSGRWRELQPWHNDDVASVEVRLEVDPPFVPSEHDQGRDHRILGIGTGEIEWRGAVAEEGLGFHEWETGDDTGTFRWTSRRWASIPVSPVGSSAHFRVHAAHPNINTNPVGLDIYWNEELVDSLTLFDSGWTTVTIPSETIGPDDGVLTLAVDRTWSPAATRPGDDARTLGVGVSAIDWR